jgi:outer membrane protein assembly factor BamB
MNKEAGNEQWGSNELWNRIAAASAVFALLICILLIANYIQYKKADPVNMTVVSKLVDRLRDNPADSVMRREIRTLDLLSRKAYFTSQWQIRTGGYLILASLALMILSLQIVDYRKKINPVLNENGEDDSLLQRAKARKWILTGGASILVVAIIFAILASNNLAESFKKMAKPDTPAVGTGGNGTVAEQTTANDEPKAAPAVQAPVANEQQPAAAETQVENNQKSAKNDTLPAKAATSSSSSDNYPNFRGYGGTGVAMKKNIPVSWDGAAGTHVLWKTPIPLPGYNSPVIWGDRVFVTGASGGSQEVYCLDRNSGKISWTAKVGTGAKKAVVKEETGLAAPTAATDGKAVYAIFPTGDIAAIGIDGKKLWERDLGLPKNYYGHASSLMLFRDKVIVQYDQTGSPVVMALSVSTGETQWSTPRPVKVSWSSPVLVNTGKRTELMLVAEPYVASYDPATGKELWKIDCINGEVGPSLAYANGIVFSVNDYSKLSAIQTGDQPKVLWENNEFLSDIPSPAATGKYLFLATSYGTVACYDAVSGQKYWDKDLGGNIFSSPVIADGKVYIIDRTGVAHIIQADKEFRLVGEPKLGESTVCTPAFTNGRIYIRGDQNLYCIGE